MIGIGWRLISLTPFLLFFLSSIHTADAVDETNLKQRVVGPVLNYSADKLQTCSDCWIQLKFEEGTDIDIAGHHDFAKPVFVERGGLDLQNVNRLIENAVEIEPTFSGDRERFRQYKQLGERKTGIEAPDLGLWFNVRFPASREIIADKLNAFNNLDAVEIAHPIPEVGPAVFFPGSTPDFTAAQDYLYDTPFGLDAPAAWALPGGRGEGVKFIDVERGWFRDHEDFDQSKFFFDGMDSNNTNNFDHGTAVLGEVVGMNNEFGVVGFASDALWGTVAYPTSSHPNVADNFIEAAEALDPGDVWLIEIQMFPINSDPTPMEYLQANFDAIWTSSFVLEVICVEAGANGSWNLDSGVFNGIFDRDVRDSGAILVAAGRPFTLTAENFSNYGSRIDAHAWGSSIVTTGYGDLQNEPGVNADYTAGFGGTSGASPMIVGACLCLQGIQKAQNNGQVLTPVEMRALINSTGTPHQDSAREIGPRPDIAAAIEGLPQCLLGDVNQDRVIDLLDVSPFVDLLVAGTYQCQADVNGDNEVTLLDVAPFVALLSGN